MGIILNLIFPLKFFCSNQPKTSSNIKKFPIRESNPGLLRERQRCYRYTNKDLILPYKNFQLSFETDGKTTGLTTNCDKDERCQ